MVFQRKKIGGSRKDKILGLHIHLNKFRKGTHKKPDDQGKEVWGLMKRAKIEDVNRKLYLF